MTVSQNIQNVNVSGSGARMVGWIVTVIFIIAMAVCFLVVNYDSSHDREYIKHAAAIRVLSQKIAKNANETFASNNNTDAFPLLENSRDQLEAHFQVLKNGYTNVDQIPKVLRDDPLQAQDELAQGWFFLSFNLPPTKELGEDAAKDLAKVENHWNDIKKNVDKILARKDSIIDVKLLADDIRIKIPAIQEQLDDIAKKTLSSGASNEQIYYLARLSYHSEQIVKNVDSMLSVESSNVSAATRLNQSREDFLEVINALRFGNQSLGVARIASASRQLRQIQSDFDPIDEGIKKIMKLKDDGKKSLNLDLYEVRDSAGSISKTSNLLLAACNQIVQMYENQKNERLLQEWYGMVFGVLALLMVILMGILSRKEAKRRIESAIEEKRVTDEETERNQQAILELLDEIQGLSEGDLTSHASVGEAFTGAIADAFNSAIDALRQLVTTINGTSVQISSAAEQTQATAMHLAEASDHQAHQITAASAAINEMAVSIDQVSKNSEESTLVAQKSVDLSVKGAETVRKTISGMDSIREQIQETSKRIKRLGESSQEIGNIVELINDIADQTNILALNASIQAAMAGEAGRGFAVVADEVQRLAERSSNATKQIEALVKTIQTDTNEAVISMEQSTAGVVSGAKQAEASGDALREIESVSTHLANLVQNISEAARQQANAAANISDTMNVIQEITSQTSAGTNETATSIGNLADLANDLRESVAGFKLPR